MLDPRERAGVAEQFGVADEQVARDHVISHLLALLSAELPEAVTFFGGTALARSHLPDGRLSEDLDLIANAPAERSEVARAVEQLFVSGLRRSFRDVRWDPPPTAVREPGAAVLWSSAGSVRIQLLRAAGYPPWPTEVVELVQRYADAGPARLRVPTLPAFAAWKTAAWQGRSAARDLWDLWALAGIDAIDAVAARLYVGHGPTGRPPSGWLFDRVPGEVAWRAALGGQTRLSVRAEQAAAVVAEAWRRATA